MTRSRALGLAVVLAVPLIVVTFFLGVGRPSSLAAVGGNSGSFAGTGVWMIAQFGFLAAGALVASRLPNNSVGWLFFITGALGLLSTFSNEYALQGYSGTELPMVDVAAWLAACVSFFITPLFALLLLRFPTGSPPSARWRWNEWLIGASLLLGVGAAVAFWSFRGPQILRPDIDELEGAGVGVALGTVVFVTATIAAVAALVSMVFRYRRASSDERHQLKWFAYAAAAAVVAVLVGPVFQLVGEEHENLVTAAGGVLLPIAAGIAILKYRLYDIDVVINKTMVFGLLAAFITVVYVAVVVGVGTALGSRGEPNLALSIAATAIVAVAFSPARERAQAVANRLVYGNRLAPYEVLTNLSKSVANAPSPLGVLEAVARASVMGLNCEGAAVTLDSEGGVLTFNYPPETSPSGNELSYPISHSGESLGSLQVWKKTSDPFTTGDNAFLKDLCDQAGLALYNARLAIELQSRLDEIATKAEELRSSRERIVSAADTARRRLEEQITSGPRSALLELQRDLDALEDLIKSDSPACASALERLSQAANDTLDAVRDLARGLYPPLLADKGLVAALEAHIRKRELDASLDVPSDMATVRFDEEIETTLYFCCVEALQDHQDRATTIVIGSDDSAVTCSIAPCSPPPQTLVSITDRIEALSGSVAAGGDLELRVPTKVLEVVT